VVAPGWLWALVRALRQDPRLGLVGPTANAVGNEARVRTGYDSLDEMLAWAEKRTWRKEGRGFSVPMLAFFCAAIRREVWEEVGELDEGFGLGLFEDDDYCRRLRWAGLRLRVRSDAFVHHWQQASFGHLASERYIDLYERNQAYYRGKRKGD
jgi:GT2 family glycosyltransferase